MIPFNDLAGQIRPVRARLAAAVGRVLSRGPYILGPEVERFEAEFARFLGVPHCVGVASGTDAVTLSLMALGIGPGDEVITTALTAFPTVTGILRAGARPIPVDIRRSDGLIDPARIEAAVTRRTKAVVPVHLYGQSCDMGAILEIARARGLSVVEDCAQSAGARYQGRMTGAIGDCGAFSFYPTKNLGTCGDGGAVVTRSRRLRDRLRALRNYGQKRRDDFALPGFNSRLDELHAAMLRVRLRGLGAANRERVRLAAFYRGRLRGLALTVNPYGRPAPHLFVVRVPRRDRVRAALAARGIQTLVHYPVPVHRQRAIGRVRGRYPEAEAFAREILSLPFYPGLSRARAERVARAVLEAVR